MVSEDISSSVAVPTVKSFDVKGTSLFSCYIFRQYNNYHGHTFENMFERCRLFEYLIKMDSPNKLQKCKSTKSTKKYISTKVLITQSFFELQTPDFA